MTRTPEPRPALKKAPDGALHPAAPKAAPPAHLHPAPQAPSAPPPPTHAVDPAQPSHVKVTKGPWDLRARKEAAALAAKAGKVSKKEELVTLEVQVPKKLRKAAKKKAAAEGWTLDQALTYVLRAWTEG